MLLGMSVFLNRTGRWGRHNVSTPCTVGIITKIVLISITWLFNLVAKLLVPCQLSRDVVGYEVSNKWRLDVSAFFFIDNSNIVVLTVVLKTDHTSEKMGTNDSSSRCWSLFSFVKEPKKRLFTSFGVVPWQELEKISWFPLICWKPPAF